MRALRKHCAELGLSYASVHTTCVDAPKGWLRSSATRLIYYGCIFEFASAMRRKAPSVCLILKVMGV
jgi:hypothetical protein